MTRATNFALISAALTLVYLVFLFGILPVPLLSKSVAVEILPTIPWWVLVSTGSFLLFKVGWGLYHFNNVPKAHDELLLDIKVAKDFLRERGVTVD
ncbi:uncharacterized protein MJAP1_000537 [Malassezia japonica]|uniref:Dolichol-phosphate mannosyltransferase subunit 3 n=1 Tax=Malassezia japonica TaxID=223818 RepID=A0AAF0JE64_9BASI|nr:uncharacterized protein MJAP1_000537 [Malassezia japonica]WFD37591.1 hypothetical protein MJAP1_000537 [Malassezia japonica]